MQIILTKDIAPKKGWVTGRIFNWPRPTITSMEKQLGGKDWYSFSAEWQRQRDSAVIAGRPRGRPKKEE